MFKKIAENILKDDASESVSDALDRLMKKLIRNENDRRNTAEILKILTSKPQHELRVPPENLHRLTSIPRGHCLVINVFRFKGESKCRDGSDRDFANAKDLWRSLGYEVTAYQNKSRSADGYSELTIMDIDQLVKNFAQMDCHEEVDSSVVIIMTHGTVDRLNPRAVNLLGSDMETVNTERLINHFSLVNCPHLAHKPKFFFFQACRGKLVSSTRVETDSEVPFETDNACADLPDGAHSHSSLLDTGNQLIVFPSAPGFISIRDPREGSWFIQAMCNVFSQNAYNTDVLTMLDMVSDYVRENYINRQEGDVVVSQVLCVEKRGFDRYVFF